MHHQLLHCFADILVDFSLKKEEEKRDCSEVLASLTRGDVPDVRSVLPGFWDTMNPQSSAVMLPNLLPWLPARARCTILPSVPGALAALPMCRAQVQHKRNTSFPAPLHWTEFGARFCFLFAPPALTSRNTSARWSDGDGGNLFGTCCLNTANR